MEHYRQGKRSITIPIWICGPSQLGRHNLTVHFYYEPSKQIKGSSERRRQLAYRMVRVDLTTVVHPSLSLTAVRNPSCLHENDLSQAILVNVINTAGIFLSWFNT